MHALQLVMYKSAIPTSSQEILADQQGGAAVVFLQQVKTFNKQQTGKENRAACAFSQETNMQEAVSWHYLILLEA